MKTAVKSPESAVYRRAAEHSFFQRFSFQHFSVTQIPLFPALRSGQWLSQRPSSQKQIPSSQSQHLRGRRGGVLVQQSRLFILSKSIISAV